MTRRLAAFTHFFLLAGLTLAHDTWVRPENPRVAPGQTVRLEATSGMEFPNLGSPIAPDRLARADYRLDGKTLPITDRKASKDALALTVRPGGTGVAVVAIESKPRAIDLKPSQVEEYLEEIGAREIASEWKKTGSGRWHETYTKHAKTFFRVGDRIRDSSWAEPAGMALEIIPESDPTDLRTGVEFSIKVLKEGRALPGFPVIALAAGWKTGTLVKTDADGKARFRLDRRGWWLIKGTHLARSPATKSDWESHFTTLTAFVR